MPARTHTHKRRKGRQRQDTNWQIKKTYLDLTSEPEPTQGLETIKTLKEKK